jgi:hypothetical protein
MPLSTIVQHCRQPEKRILEWIYKYNDQKSTNGGMTNDTPGQGVILIE